VCDVCYNEDEGLCTECAPRQEVYVAKAKQKQCVEILTRREKIATVWKGKLKVRPQYARYVENLRNRKFCNNCGASMEMKICQKLERKMRRGKIL
jgi:hypothetical protein